jgi:predicted nucleic acid-binding Zn ribbon protein
MTLHAHTSRPILLTFPTCNLYTGRRGFVDTERLGNHKRQFVLLGFSRHPTVCSTALEPGSTTHGARLHVNRVDPRATTERFTAFAFGHLISFHCVHLSVLGLNIALLDNTCQERCQSALLGTSRDSADCICKRCNTLRGAFYCAPPRLAFTAFALPRFITLVFKE